MNFNELLEKYEALEAENRQLKERIKQLEITTGNDSNTSDDGLGEEAFVETPVGTTGPERITRQSSPIEKIDLFISLFKGRTDVYATRWENNKKGTSGYSPACGNEWRSGICQKPKIKCAACPNKKYLELNNQVIEDHLRGKIVVGIYPLLLDETCWFLAIDFDGDKWQKDIKTIRKICSEFNIPTAVERSRSGMAPMHGSSLKSPLPQLLHGNLEAPYFHQRWTGGIRLHLNRTTGYSPTRTPCPKEALVI